MSTLNIPLLYRRSKRLLRVVQVLVLLFVVLWFILWGDLFYVLSCVILFLCFSVLIALQLPHLGKRELILELFLHLFDLFLFGFVCFLILLVSGKGCGLWLWHSLDFSLTFFFPKLSPFASWPGTMINPLCLELPMSPINFHWSLRCSSNWGCTVFIRCPYSTRVIRHKTISSSNEYLQNMVWHIWWRFDVLRPFQHLSHIEKMKGW